MNINIKIMKNFATQYNKLQEEFGTEIARLNGFDDGQLSYTDFIDNFIKEDTVADASIDGNSNVGNKDIVTLEREMSKPHAKLLAFNKIYYEIHKRYGFKAANEWLRKEWTGELYMHDAPSSTFRSYSYKGSETIVVKYKGIRHLASFEDLYDLVDEKEELLSEEDMSYCKYTKDLVVWDKDNTWTSVIRVIKKPKNKNQFHFIKVNNGISEIVTGNHPIITTKGDKNAVDITNEDVLITQSFNEDFGNVDTIYVLEELNNPSKPIMFRGEAINENVNKQKKGQVSYFYATNPIQNVIPLDFDYGWLIGIIIADGSHSKDTICITQNKGAIYDNIINILEDKNYGYSISKKENNNTYSIRIRSQIFSDLIFKCFITGNNSTNYHLRTDILKYNKNFIKGIISGILDGDGTLTQAQGRRIHIRTTSRTLMAQLGFIIRMFGYTVREQTPSLYRPNTEIVQHNYVYHIAFTPYKDVENFDSIKIRNHNVEYTSKEEEGRYTNGKYTFGFGEKNVSNNEILIHDKDEYVYDISVDTGHFMCNNILSHNCFAYDLKDLAEKGLYFIDGQNAQPAQHLITFVDFIKEFVSYASNRTSGAVGLPNLIPYMYYFWKKDVDNNYIIRDPEYYAKQNFQRFIYAVNQPYVRDGSQSAFTNTSVFDHPYFEALFGGGVFPDGTFMIDYEEEIIEFQKWYMEVMSEIRSIQMFTFPVSTISLLRQNGEFVDKGFAKWAIQHNMKWSDSNLFVDDSVNSLSNCCRLKSSIKDLGYFNSIGGTSLKVGSVKVSTINLARIALDTKNEEDYLSELEHRVEVNLQALDAVRHIIQRNVDKGILPNFTHGLIDFEHLYNTIGFIGIYETMKKFGYITLDAFGNTYYTDKASVFGKKIFDTMRKAADKFIADNNCDYQINTEQIPGESAAAKLMKKDKFFYPKAKVYDLPLYGNQFIPLGIQTTIQERIRIASEFDKYCNGGSILHVNTDAPFDSFEKAWEMTNYIADQGVTYFAFNTKIQVCEENHAFYGTICPTCGKPVDAEYTRIVGFYTRTKTWSDERKAEYKMRKWDSINKTVEELK